MMSPYESDHLLMAKSRLVEAGAAVATLGTENKALKDEVRRLWELVESARLLLLNGNRTPLSEIFEWSKQASVASPVLSEILEPKSPEVRQ